MRRAPLPGRGVLGGFASVLGGLVGVLGGPDIRYTDDWACVPSLGEDGKSQPTDHYKQDTKLQVFIVN